MEAIQHILNLEKATSPDEADAAMMEAHTAVNDLHLAKLKEMETDLAHRLGVKSALHQSPMGIIGSTYRNDEAGGGGATSR